MIVKTITAAATALVAARLVVNSLFARHCCRTIFNRRPPKFLIGWRFLHVTRPLQMLWRFLSAPLRVAGPDVMLLGEVRCGTTTLAALLRSELGMVGPFTPWDVELANNKESFFFAGHYFGLVAPQLYRLCFPLRAVRWLERALLHWRGDQQSLLFDGCASHLSAPWAPRLVSELQAVVRRGRPMVFIVCVREPVSQHLSWWRLEHDSMAFAQHLELGDHYHGPPTRRGYPPATFEDALTLARSTDVGRLWADADSLAADSGSLLRRLPDWALPFPNGQLSAFERFGRYAESVQRWFDFFERDAFVFVNLDELAANPEAVLDRIASRCAAVLGIEPPRRSHHATTLSAGSAVAVEAPVLNASPDLPPALEPHAECLKRLGAHYRPLNEALYRLVGNDLGWHDDPRYPWYTPEA